MNTILTKLFQKLATTNENDPTFSNRIRQQKTSQGVFVQAAINKSDNSVNFRKYENNKQKGTFPIGTRNKYWIHPSQIYKELQNLRISSSAFDLRFNKQAIELDTSDISQQIQEELKKISSPFDISKDSEYLGLFFDGTGNWCEQSNTNVYKLCQYYTGNKYYYGGIGNFIENNYVRGIVKSMIAHDFNFNIERALFDIKEYVTRKKQKPKIQLIGFSRGAAQANELAKRIKDEFEIDILLMMDPVYSIGAPGQGSLIIHKSPLGASHNYVETYITDNVKRTIVLYASHETRIYFPATKFTFDKNKTRFIAGISPGNHCDVGGYKERNGDFQDISLLWMLENIYSENENDPFSGDLTLDQWKSQIKENLNKITKNPNSRWDWSEIDWFYTLPKNAAKILGDIVEKVIDDLTPDYIFGECLGENIRHILLGDQQDVTELKRNFSTFGYPLKSLREWLQEKDSLPITYNYIDKPSNNTTNIV